MQRKLLIFFAAAWTVSALVMPDPALGNTGHSNGLNFNQLVEEEIRLPSPASPTCCIRFYDHAHATNTSRRVMWNINQRISTLQLAIIEALRLSTGQISGTIREQTAAEHSLADKQDDRATVKEIENARMEAVRDSIPGTSSCAIISGSAGAESSVRRDGLRNEIAIEVNSWSEGEPDLTSSLGRDQAALALADMHCSKYATSKSVSTGLCEKEGDLPGGDRNIAKSIFHQSDNSGHRLPPDRIEASTAFMLNAVDPTPLPPVSDVQASTPQGRIRSALRNSSIARVSTANETLSFLTSQRVPLDDPVAKSWAAEHAKGMRGLEGIDFSDGVSHLDWMRLHSQHFLLNPDWIGNSDINVATATKAAKNVLAVLAYQGFENYKLMERIAANLAIQTAILNAQLLKK